MDRLEKIFRDNSEEGKHTLIGYLTAGDPGCTDTVELAGTVHDAGVDILELGVPYSDPLADGPVLREAASRSLSVGVTPEKVLVMAEEIIARENMPVVLLVYYNTVFRYGLENFCRRCRRAGIAGLVIPDLPCEEKGPLLEHLEDICLIPLVALSSGSRIPAVLEGARGFVYCVSSRGVTGMRDCFDREVASFLKSVRANTGLPLAVGFGISKREHVDFFSSFTDGIIVGTALMKKAVENRSNPEAVAMYIEKELR